MPCSYKLDVWVLTSSICVYSCTHHSPIPSFPHSLIPLFLHSLVPSFPLSFPPSLSPSLLDVWVLTSSICVYSCTHHSPIPSFPHSLVPPFPRSLIPSLLSSLPLSFPPGCVGSNQLNLCVFVHPSFPHSLVPPFPHSLSPSLPPSSHHSRPDLWLPVYCPRLTCTAQHLLKRNTHTILCTLSEAVKQW